MKYLSKVMLGYFVAAHSLFASESIMDRLDGPDILASTKRLKTLFLGQSVGQPLGNDGSCSFDRDKAYISFRGSRSNFLELLQIANTDKKELSGYSIRGKVQKNAYDIFKTNEQSMLNCVKSYSAANHISFNDIKFTVEGYSRGTTFAKLAAISIMDNLGIQPVNVLNYSPISIFDQQAADQYNARIGKQNHINFMAKEDFVPPIFTGQKPLNIKVIFTKFSLKGDFKSVGTDIEFSGYNSSSYREKVQSNKYPYLDPNFAAFMPRFLSAEAWNAHMPELYEDMSDVYFREHKRLHLKG